MSPPRRARPRARSFSPPRRPWRPAREVGRGPRAAVHRGRRCRRVPRRGGILTSEGGKASHAALVARGMGRPAVTGAADSTSTRTRARPGRGHGPARGRPDRDRGSSGQVTIDDVPLVRPEVDERFATVLEWCDEIRTLGVRANADTPADARRAREFGAEGIGLCRTEHMFMAADRLPKMRAMVMAVRGPPGTSRSTIVRASAGRLRGPVRGDAGAPVTIRLLDPPLHEFLPDARRICEQLSMRSSSGAEHSRGWSAARTGAGAGRSPTPCWAPAACGSATSPRDLRDAGPCDPRGSREECRSEGESRCTRERLWCRRWRPRRSLSLSGQGDFVDETRGGGGEARSGAKISFRYGTMIEVVRACLRAGSIAQVAEFFSFGTNDLTQATFSFFPARTPRTSSCRCYIAV